MTHIHAKLKLALLLKTKTNCLMFKHHNVQNSTCCCLIAFLADVNFNFHINIIFSIIAMATTSIIQVRLCSVRSCC